LPSQPRQLGGGQGAFTLPRRLAHVIDGGGVAKRVDPPNDGERNFA
jgi:hypothetical protein